MIVKLKKNEKIGKSAEDVHIIFKEMVKWKNMN